VKKPFLAWFAVVLCAGIFGCGTGKDINAAGVAVGLFHARLDTEDYATIYSQADPRFRAASKQEDFLKFMNAVHNKLGIVENASRQGYFVNFSTSGTQIRLNYATKFSSGEAHEEFVWTKNGDNLVLLAYHINSNELITK
jgi:hypothetical protein